MRYTRRTKRRTEPEHEHRGPRRRRARRDPRARRDASAGWREEYDAQGVPAAVPAADGGRYLLPNRGAKVRDRDTDDELLVVDVHPDTPAREFFLEGPERTVAALNREYDPDAPVIDAVYLEAAEEYLAERDGTEPITEAAEAGDLRAYSFPAPRLAAVEGGEGE